MVGGDNPVGHSLRYNSTTGEGDHKDTGNSHIPSKLLVKRELPHLPIIKQGVGVSSLGKQSKMEKALVRSRNAYLGISSKSN